MCIWDGEDPCTEHFWCLCTAAASSWAASITSRTSLTFGKTPLRATAFTLFFFFILSFLHFFCDFHFERKM